jgi:beta-phosphoglucomutase-like phosphatase (HAD superfamily)
MREVGLSWQWDRNTYADLLMQAGAKERLEPLAAATNTHLSAATIEYIHSRKTELVGAIMVVERVPLRPAVADLIALGKRRGMKLAFVTTTYQPNIDAVFSAAGDALASNTFDTIVSRDDVRQGKPAPDAYRKALATLGLLPDAVLAIEDTATSVMSAKRAGIAVVATPGAIIAGQDFWQADLVVATLAGVGGIHRRSDCRSRVEASCRRLS